MAGTVREAGEGLPEGVAVRGLVASFGAEETTGGRVTRPVNLLAGLPRQLPDELFTTLLEAAGVRVERIVSHGHASPPGFWYDQDDAEWVLVLKGAAVLEFEDAPEPLRLAAG